MKNRRYSVIILLVLVILSCIISYRIDKNNNSSHPDITVTPIIGNKTNNASPTIIVPDIFANDYELKIYTIDSTGYNVVPVTALIYNEEITPELIVDYVIESMEDNAYYFIEVLEVITENDTVIVDFSSETPPCLSVSEKIENAILDSFAQSIVDNLADCKKIIFRTDGGYYKSDNKSFTKDYVHIDNK